MGTRLTLILRKLFCDKNGHIIIAQAPNLPIIGWLAAKGLSLLLPASSLKTELELLGKVCLCIWAYLEITQGVNYFRKILGGLVMAAVVASFFM
jgi:hypothetical protein